MGAKIISRDNIIALVECPNEENETKNPLEIVLKGGTFCIEAPRKHVCIRMKGDCEVHVIKPVGKLELCSIPDESARVRIKLEADVGELLTKDNVSANFIF